MAPTIQRLIPLEPLTADGFASFGSVVQNPSSTSTQRAFEHISPVQANQGSATKFPNISPLDDFYGQTSTSGRGAISLFSCAPRPLETEHGRALFRVNILERHPFTTQTFAPLGLQAEDAETRYLVIVAPTVSTPRSTTVSQSQGQKGTGPPDLTNIRAFLARGDQAVTYGAGTWHAPMVVLGKKAVDFMVVQFVNGVADNDCQEKEFDKGIAVDLEHGFGALKAKL